jgi:hypothetical protein
MGKVMSCQPRPDSRRRAITKGTGAWIERNQRVESFCSFALQYPKGRLRIKTNVATVTIFIGISQFTACKIVRRNGKNYKREETQGNVLKAMRFAVYQGLDVSEI